MKKLIFLFLLWGIFCNAQYNLFARQNFNYKTVSTGTNTEIGGVASTISTPALLATKLAIDVSRISNFTIVGSDIKCKITGGSYSIPVNCFRNPVLGITYYDDRDGLVNVLNSECFGGSYGETALNWVNFPNVTSVIQSFNFTPNLKIIELPKATSITGTAFGDCEKKTIYAPLCTTLGSSNLNNDVFLSITGSPIIYVHPSLATNNAGSPDGDLDYAITRGATVRYVTNFTAPNPVTTLSAGTIYNTAVQLNFTAPSSTNAIEYYELYFGGVLQTQKITASGQYITGLTPSTSYSNITLIAVDIFLNKSVVSNSLSVSTTSDLSDTDATAYTTASLNTTYQYAINDLFKGLKDNSLYTKLQAFYPFLGTTAAQHKWNGKNPLDTNAAFRLTFTGAATFSNNGYQLNGSSYANTYFTPSANQNVNSNGLTLVCGTNNSAFSADVVDIGSFNSVTQSELISPKNNNSNYNKISRVNSNQVNYSGGNESRGILTVVKQSSTVTDMFWNGAQVSTGNSGGTLPTINIYIGCLNLSGTTYGNSNQRIQFTAIHEGLSDAEVATLHTIIDTFETAIGRKTW